MVPPSRTGSSGRAAGVAVAFLAALLAPAGVGAQVPGPPQACIQLQPADAAAGDLFACALAMDGDAAAVGSVLDDDRGSASGSVYVFGRNAGDQWAQAAKLLASDGAAGDQLGYAVAFADGRLVAGAPFRNEAGADSGAVYLFQGAGGSWSQVAKLALPGLGARDELGRAVALSGFLAAAGAPGDDDRGSSAGAVYAFALDGPGGGPGTVQKLIAADGAAADGFGFSLALSNQTLVVGAPFADEGGAQAGAAYVFERQQNGSWVETAKLTAADRRPASLFGWSVAVAGDRVAVGARVDDGAGANAGAAYVFTRAGGSWSQQAKLLPPGLAAGDELGSSVALSGDSVVAGARFAAVDGVARAGVAWVFAREGGSWVVRHRLTAATPGAGDELGFAVGVAAGTVLAGAYRDDDAGGDAGTLCVFEAAAGPRQADLFAVKSGVAVVAPGDPIRYGVSVGNDGPATAAGARVVDDLPATLTGCTWTCSGAGGALCGAAAGTGDVDQEVTLPPAGTLLFQIDCTVSPNAAGTITNTATIAAPAGIVDPDPSDNSSTTVAAVGPSIDVDLATSKSNGQDELVCGGTTTYTIRVLNAGIVAVGGARVVDDFPPALDCTWTCAGTAGVGCPQPPSGAGDIDASVANLPPGGSATFTAACAVAATASGTVSNTATVSITSPGAEDDNPGNDSATDADPVVCDPAVLADLAVTKTDGTDAVTAGLATTYTIAAVNNGPAAVTGARVADDFQIGLAGCSWTCTAAGGAACGAAGGEGDLDQAVSLPAGGSVTYTAECAIGAFAPDQVTNTATVTVPAGVTDPVPGNDSATDVDSVLRVADVGVTKTADRTTVSVGDTLVYTVRVVNDGPSGTSPVFVTDHFPAGLDCLWQCTGTGGGACASNSEGLGDIVEVASLAPGGAVTYTVQCTVLPAATGTLVNTAAAAVPAGVTDPVPTNDSASATVEVVAFADLSITKTDSLAQTLAGQPLEYTIVVANAGPDDAESVRILDRLPANLVGAGWACGSEVGTGDLDVTVDLPADSSLVCTVTGVTPQGFCGRLENTALVAPGPATSDPDFADQTATDSTLIQPQPAMGGAEIAPCASKGLLTGPHVPGSTVTYEVLLMNGGPLPVFDGPADEFRDILPPEVTGVTAVADAGVVAVLPPGDVVTWNGTVAPGEVVTILISGTVGGEPGDVVVNQGQFGDPQLLVVPTDDPDTAAPTDPTAFTIASVLEIPTLGAAALALLAALLALAALRRLRYRLPPTTTRRPT